MIHCRIWVVISVQTDKKWEITVKCSKSIKLQCITDFRYILKTFVVAVILRKHHSYGSHCTRWNNASVTLPQPAKCPSCKDPICNISVFSEEIKKKKKNKSKSGMPSYGRCAFKGLDYTLTSNSINTCTQQTSCTWSNRIPLSSKVRYKVCISFLNLSLYI